MTFVRARGLLLVSGLILISLVSLIAISRGVDRVEVIATLLFIPVFAGFLFWGIKGGFWLGLVAALTYIAIRIPAMRLVGLTAMSGQLAARILGYLGFGLGGGWAAQQIKATLDKFELHDDIDDETGLGNARSMIEVTDTEKARADRYQKVFSVVLADLSGAQWSDEPNRRQRVALQELGRRVKAAIRSSDHAAHGRQKDHHLIGLVLPETGPEGARIASENLRKVLIGSSNPGVAIRLAQATYPGEGLAPVVDLFGEIDRASRPADRS